MKACDGDEGKQGTNTVSVLYFEINENMFLLWFHPD